MHGVCPGSPGEQSQLLHCKGLRQKAAGAGIDLGIVSIFAEPKLQGGTQLVCFPVSSFMTKLASELQSGDAKSAAMQGAWSQEGVSGDQAKSRSSAKAAHSFMCLCEKPLRLSLTFQLNFAHMMSLQDVSLSNTRRRKTQGAGSAGTLPSRGI